MFKSKPKPKDGIPSGPAATAFIDARKRRDGFVMHDVTVPGAYKAPYIVASAIASNSLQVSEFPAGGQWENLLQVCLCLFIILTYSVKLRVEQPQPLPCNLGFSLQIPYIHLQSNL